MSHFRIGQSYNLPERLKADNCKILNYPLYFFSLFFFSFSLFFSLSAMLMSLVQFESLLYKSKVVTEKRVKK